MRTVENRPFNPAHRMSPARPREQRKMPRCVRRNCERADIDPEDAPVFGDQIRAAQEAGLCMCCWWRKADGLD